MTCKPRLPGRLPGPALPRGFPRADQSEREWDGAANAETPGCHSDTPQHPVLTNQATWDTVLGKHTGVLVSVLISAEWETVGWDLGVGETVAGESLGFQHSWRFGTGRTSGFGGSGQTEEMEGGAASTVGVFHYRGAGLGELSKARFKE